MRRTRKELLGMTVTLSACCLCSCVSQEGLEIIVEEDWSLALGFEAPLRGLESAHGGRVLVWNDEIMSLLDSRGIANSVSVKDIKVLAARLNSSSEVEVLDSAGNVWSSGTHITHTLALDRRELLTAAAPVADGWSGVVLDSVTGERVLVWWNPQSTAAAKRTPLPAGLGDQLWVREQAGQILFGEVHAPFAIHSWAPADLSGPRELSNWEGHEANLVGLSVVPLGSGLLQTIASVSDLSQIRIVRNSGGSVLSLTHDTLPVFFAGSSRDAALLYAVRNIEGYEIVAFRWSCETDCTLLKGVD
ncbi:MAG: hypothetical protein LC667_12960 [Thioalkalivibrio sp.]|nr:hypothetical protein [Thioalkalivibrio sp.]